MQINLSNFSPTWRELPRKAGPCEASQAESRGWEARRRANYQLGHLSPAQQSYTKAGREVREYQVCEAVSPSM